MISLGGRPVFLSASFPSGERGARFPPADPAAIADAVTAVVRAVLEADGRVVFGGHPTISPLVLLVAGEHGRTGAVEIHQSRAYDHVIPEETRRLERLGLGEIVWTEAAGDASLVVMREAMLERRPAAGVFVGGMGGVVDEHAALEGLHPDVPRYVIAAPGGAARALAQDFEPPDGFEPFMESPRYPAVARAIVEGAARYVDGAG